MKNWYDNAIIYQIYPKSFQDTNGDGIGDLNGIKKRIPYLKSLGVNAIWLNPVFVSPQIDNGYDVSNYFAIDPQMGTMADMESLIHELHKNGIHLIMDFVLNHTSDQHPWFQDAIKNPEKLHVYNLGSGHGVSVKEIVETFEKVNNLKLNYKYGSRREGDLKEFFADPSKALKDLGWKTEKSIEDMCRDSYNFIKKNSQK